MNTKQAIIGLLASVIMCGCGVYEPQWVLRHEPTTDAERKAVAEHVERILAATPKTLSGNDQDWDDAIRAAHANAKETLCRPTLWEWVPREFTGRWKYVEETK